jgi:glycosyltransferase involved in cell wall biosynthesis
VLSVVIPVFNEEESLEELHRQLDEVASAEGYELDIIFIDDGSSDRSWEMIHRLASSDPRVQGLKFRRNFGKAAALSVGFSKARGEYVMTLDADLQDDPAEIPSFLAEIAKGYDVVSGWKKTRHDPWHKVGPSRVFNWMVSKLTGVKLHDHNCGMKCYLREIFDEVRLYGELHRFVPVLAAARGYRVSEVVVQHRARQFGYSKYGVARFVKGFLDLLTVRFLTGFGQRPQHLLGTIGLTSFFLGVLGLTYLAAIWVITRVIPGLDPVHLHETPSVLYSVALLLLGGQFMSIGFVAELFIAYHDPDIKAYSVSERTDQAEAGPKRPHYTSPKDSDQ